MDLKDVSKEESISCCYGSTLEKDSSCTLGCSWTEADPSTFLIRGNNYLAGNRKVSIQFSVLFGKDNQEFKM